MGKKKIIVNGSSAAGPKAAVVLQAYGYTNVKVLEGGLRAWPYNKEK